MRRSALSLVLLAAPFARACITLPGAGKAPVAIADETAIVVWDEATRTERFVRTATFTASDGPIGFLVPTPTPPKLKELPGLALDTEYSAMGELRAQIAPRIVEKKRPVYRLRDDWGFGGLFSETPAAGSMKQLATAGLLYMSDADDVIVLGQGKVGGYDTAVLRANDPKALLAWLERHRFESDARLEGWLKPYVEKGWAITAFRFEPKGKGFVSAPICLTFQTDRPFYPYREPAATNAPASRSLRVFLVAPERRAGSLETGPWPTAAEYAGPVSEDGAAALAEALELPESALRGRWLTSFLDKRPVRPDSELYFDVDRDPKPVEPPPVVRYVDDPVEVPRPVAAGAVGVPALALAALGARLRRARAKRRAA